VASPQNTQPEPMAGLFDASALYVAPPASADPDLSPDRRRTLRQGEAIAAGRHPLTRGPLHPSSLGRYASKGDAGMPFTCGSCRFREVLKYHNGSYPKCLRDLTYGGHDAASVTYSDVKNVSHGASTDVRGWWPACTGYEAGDPGLSPDAARCVPGGDA